MQQGDQTPAIGMQKAEVTCPPETLGQHMLQDQPEELRAGYGAQLGPPGLGILIAKDHLTVAASKNVLLAEQ